MKSLRWNELDAAARRQALARPGRGVDAQVAAAVARVLEQVRADGDGALRGAWHSSNLLAFRLSTPSSRRSSMAARSPRTSAKGCAGPASTASLSSTVATSLSWLASSVCPDDTMSQIASALPSRGAISTEPDSITASAAMLRSRSHCVSRCG